MHIQQRIMYQPHSFQRFAIDLSGSVDLELAYLIIGPELPQWVLQVTDLLNV